MNTVKTVMPPATEITSLGKGINTFAFELWAHTSGAGNVGMSPVGVSTALAMAWAGAMSTTAEEMRKVMHFEGATEAIMSQWARVLRALQDRTRPLELRMANRVYGEAHHQFSATYHTSIRTAFDSAMETVSFATEPETARAKINTWVAEKTEQRIKGLLPPRSVAKDTKLVIVSAIYFLADWAEPFEPEATYARDFFVTSAQKVQVPTMHRHGTYMHAKTDGGALLELPYKDRSASMYILLPDQLNGLAALERDLPGKLERLRAKLASETVLVALPKFTIDPVEPMRLVPALQALGMKQAFDPQQADFSAMAKPTGDKERLNISNVLHKAFVKVDEKSTEAAAGTAVVVSEGGAAVKGTPFTADHPFLFLIVDRSTGLILFIGRVVDPR